MKKAFSIIIILILLPVLFVNVVILINSWIHPNDIPSFLGWKPFIVLSGSMESQINSGDIVVVKEIDTKKLKKGDIIAFKNEDIVITHRIQDLVTENGKTKYITKGDNNNVQDKDLVLPENVEGVFQFKVSKLGNLAMFIQTPIGMLVCLSVPILLLILIQFTENSKNKKIIEKENTKHRQMENELRELRKQNEELMKK